MSTATLTRSAGDSGWDDLAALAVIESGFDLDAVEPDYALRHTEHRPSRRVADDEAIADSLREWS